MQNTNHQNKIGIDINDKNVQIKAYKFPQVVEISMKDVIKSGSALGYEGNSNANMFS